MPSFKSFWSSLAYHTVTRPAITYTQHTASKLRQHYRRKRLIKQGIDPDRRARILKLTRGTTANSGTLWSKRTASGQARRAKAARAAWGRRTPTSSPASPPPTKAKQTSLRTKVRAKTRGALAGNPRLWSKGTIAGQKRRAKAAASAWAVHRPLRSRTGDLSKVKGIAQPKPKAPVRPSVKPTAAQIANIRKTKPGSVGAAVLSTNNYGSLRRKLGGQSVRAITRRVISKGGKLDRKQRADSIRALRSQPAFRKNLREQVSREKSRRSKMAAGLLARLNQKS